MLEPLWGYGGAATLTLSCLCHRVCSNLSYLVFDVTFWFLMFHEPVAHVLAGIHAFTDGIRPGKGMQPPLLLFAPVTLVQPLECESHAED